jgi:ethanolamine ammonia-lyase large subunit
MYTDTIKRIFTQANEFKEGDMMVGGTLDEDVRMDAKKEVAAMRIGNIARLVLVDDGVTEAIQRSLNKKLFTEISHLTVAEMKKALLGLNGGDWAVRYHDALTSEIIAAVVKIMSNAELSAVAQAISNPLPGKDADEVVKIGSVGHFGSRIQPNSPGDDEEEILLSTLEGLCYGCGDVIIGLNPASDDLETIVRTEKVLQAIVERLELPTRYCVLTDIVKQATASTMTKLDVGFQSLAGTSKSLFGMVGLDVDGISDLAKNFDGLYFETGQGSEVTNGAAEGVDMVTLESRCYGAARHIRRQNGGKWMIVNDVAGFIGPEVFRSGAQLLRACLEDSVMAKLHGITMGLDVCSTFHMGIDPFELQALTETVVRMAAPAYLMAVAGKADPMLGYLTTSFREHPALRAHFGRKISSSMRKRLITLGAMDENGDAKGEPERVAGLYARYMRAGGEKRDTEALMAEGLRKIERLRDHGFDLGYGCGPDWSNPPLVAARLESINRHAKIALYATLDAAVLRDCSPIHVDVSTHSINREDYLAHPASGELIVGKDAEMLSTLHQGRKPQIQLVISDGLNANAVNVNLRTILPQLRRGLKETGFHVSDEVVVIKNGRVRAGYHVGQCLAIELLIHLIGERPGTGLDQLSAYISYGKDPVGNYRWAPEMDHAFTTVICGINPKGKTPDSAVEDILKCIKRMFELRCSGVALGVVANQ